MGWDTGVDRREAVSGSKETQYWPGSVTESARQEDEGIARDWSPEVVYEGLNVIRGLLIN